MLANDSNDQKEQGGFSLLVNAHRGVAELMGACRKCGAMTRYGLELAWRLQIVSCPECSTTMRLTEGELTCLRGGLIAARVRIDRLIGREAGDHDESGRSPDAPTRAVDT